MAARGDAQAAKGKADPKPRPANSGRAIFESRCAGCHGLDGRGGERAPDIVTSPTARALSDRELYQIIEDGLPRAGMPGFKTWLKAEEIRAVVAYLHSAGARSASPPSTGNAAAGKALFFGKAGCGSCHMIDGKGGFIGSDLSSYGDHHSAAKIRDAVLNPGGKRAAAAVVVLRGGEKLSGIVRNEDGFSIQLLDAKGTFHLLMKSELVSLKRETQPLMPKDYGSRLTSQELDSVAAYLAGRHTPVE